MTWLALPLSSWLKCQRLGEGGRIVRGRGVIGIGSEAVSQRLLVAIAILLLLLSYYYAFYYYTLAIIIINFSEDG